MKKRAALVSALLVTTMVAATLSGCKKKADAPVTPTGDVYVPSFSEFSAEMSYVENVVASGDTVTLIGSDYNYDKETETYTSYTTLLKYDIETGKSETIKKSFGEDAFVNRIVAYKDGYMAILCEMERGDYHDEDDRPVLMDNGVFVKSAAVAEETAAATTEAATTDAPATENDGYTSETVGDDYDDDFGYGFYDYTETYFIVEYDKDFNEVNRIDLSELKEKLEEEDSYFYVNNFVIDSEGNIFVCCDTIIAGIEADGSVKFQINVNTWIEDLVATSDGRILVSYYDEETYERVMAVLDKQTGKLSDSFKNMPYSRRIYAGEGSKLYIFGENNLYLFDVDKDEAEVVLNWIDSDINSDDVSGFASMGEGKFLIISSEYDYSDDEQTKCNIELAKLVKTPASEVPVKKNISLAMLYMDYSLKNSIIKFNKTNQEYRISVKTYVDEDYSNYEDALNQFKTDVGTGSIADIIVGSTYNIDFTNLAAKGAFADLYPYFEKDSSMSKEDIIPSILKALEMDGKLYMISDSFSANAILGRKSDLGNASNFTLDQFVALQKKYPNAELFQYLTRDRLLNMIINYSGGMFYNAKTGECHFDSDQFASVLELCSNYPAEYQYSDEYVSLPQLVREGKVVLQEYDLTNPEMMQLYEAIYGEPVAIVGYPTDNGAKAVAQFNRLMAVSAKSSNKDGAWEFIKGFISYENQKKLDYECPINKQAFDELLEALQHKYDDDNYSWSYDDVEVTIRNMTEAEVAQIRELVDGIENMYSINESLYNIIAEEVAAYFEGQKTAKEVAGIIQSRAQIYINEQR